MPDVNVTIEVQEVIEKMIRQSPDLYQTADDTNFKKMLSVLLKSEGSSVGRRNYFTLLGMIKRLVAESSQASGVRPLGFALEGFGIYSSIFLHIFAFCIFMTVFFYGYTVNRLKQSQYSLAYDRLGRALGKALDKYTRLLPRNSPMSEVLQAKLTNYYNSLDANDKERAANNRACVLNTVYVIVAFLVPTVICILISRYVRYDKVQWGKLCTYILTILVLFGAFEGYLFETVINKFNPVATAQEEKWCIDNLLRTITTPLQDLYDGSTEECLKDEALYNTTLFKDLARPFIQSL